MSAAQEPLLLESSSDVEAATTSPTKPASSSSYSLFRPKLVCYTILSLFGIFVLATVAYLVHTGAFDTLVDGDVRIVDGAVTEPNSHTTFPVQRSKTLSGQPLQQRLFGVTLATSSMAHVTVKILSMALYLDRAEARKTLQPYRKLGRIPSNQDHTPEGEAALVEFVRLATTSGFMYESRQLMSIPGSQMSDEWLKLLVTTWKKLGVGAADVNAYKQCFASWYNGRSFKNGDVFLYEYLAKAQSMRMQLNGKLSSVECTGQLFAQGFLQLEFEQHKELGNLLTTFWDTQYDKL